MALQLRQLPAPDQVRLPGPGWPESAADVDVRELVGRSGLALVVGGPPPPPHWLQALGGRGRRVVHLPVDWSVGPDGVTDAGIRLLGAPPDVRVAARLLPAAARLTFDRARALVDTLARELGTRGRTLPADRAVLLVFTDRTGGQDLLAAALAGAAPGLAVVGTVAPAPASLDGDARRGGAVVVLAIAEVPLATFGVHPYRPTEQRVVVTACDPSGSRIVELDGWPALDRLVELGVVHGPTDAPCHEVVRGLDAQLGWVVAGATVVRPVTGVGRHGADVLGAVQPGSVLRVLRRETDLADALLRGIRTAVAGLAVPPAAAWTAVCEAYTGCTPLTDGIERIGAIAWSAPGQLYGPVHTCGSVVGIVWGSGGR